MASPAWIGLGSNLGDRKGTLDAAVAALGETPGVAVRAVSAYRETVPVGGPAGQGGFLNAAAHLETTLDPLDLLDALQAIERRSGRVRTVRWGERTLDLDILLFGTTFLETRRLQLPHPRLGLRRFVLDPLAEIAPDLIDPASRQTIAELLANLDRRPRLVALDGPTGLPKASIFRRLVEELPAIGLARDDTEPGTIGGEGSFRSFLESVDRKLEALHPDRWEIATFAGSWVVADYHLETELVRFAMGTPRSKRYPEDPKGYMRAFDTILDRHRLAGKAVLAPTFAVILPGPPEIRREANSPGPPRLRPESDDPEAIVAEVLATARGIESP